uniref:Protein kinase domain-containing protein n=1 Tax=Rhizophagus irregularis (strain DAOM 181602 / DAOM 197198 / MUCL 43194) TaxID=747089 RepID=U9UI54_RHIID
MQIIHRDYHSGNIFVATDETPIIGDLGISKSATEPLNDDDDEIYGIIPLFPYVAPEIFQGRKYTIKASDIYSFELSRLHV